MDMFATQSIDKCYSINKWLKWLEFLERDRDRAREKKKETISCGLFHASWLLLRYVLFRQQQPNAQFFFFVCNKKCIWHILIMIFHLTPSIKIIFCPSNDYTRCNHHNFHTFAQLTRTLNPNADAQCRLWGTERHQFSNGQNQIESVYLSINFNYMHFAM